MHKLRRTSDSERLSRQARRLVQPAVLQLEALTVLDGTRHTLGQIDLLLNSTAMRSIEFDVLR